jgi:rare lipoprotein A
MKMKNYLWLILICMSFVANAQSSGYASFIGDNYHKMKMASGESYDKTTLVAGHRTLPYGTQVKITNTSNGESVIVTIKDRGPFVKGEIIAISRAAGEAIGMVYDKKTPVRIEVVGAGTTTVATTTTVEEAKEEIPAPRSVENTSKGGDIPKEYNTPTAKKETATSTKAAPKPAKKAPKPAVNTSTGVFKADIINQPKTGYGVQIGVFSDLNAVVDKVRQLKAIGFSEVYFTSDTNGGKTTYKIIIGNYQNQNQATAYKNALRSKYKLDGFVVNFSEL